MTSHAPPPSTPERRPSPDTSFDLQGHRGARGLLPENTIPGFLRALEVGATTLEMDVVITGERQVLVSHEPWMRHDICTDPSGAPIPKREEREHNIYRMTMEEIARYDCGKQHPHFPRQRPMRVTKPLLREVIRACEAFAEKHERPPVGYNIEVKSSRTLEGRYQPDPDTFVRLVHDVLKVEGVLDRSIFKSFDRRIVRAARPLEAPWRLGLLVNYSFRRSLKGQLRRLGFTPHVYAPNYRLVSPRLVQQVHKRGLQIIPWTVNSPLAMRRFIEMGVDGLITDYPDVGYQVLHGTPPRDLVAAVPSG